MNEQEEILHWQKQFRILDGWVIALTDDGEHYGHVVSDPKHKVATIFPYSDDPTEEADELYMFHEILHVCQSEIRTGNHHERREKEELYIQDTCKIMELY